MRIFSYICAGFITIFVINTVLSFSLPAYRNVLIATRSQLFPNTKSSVPLEKKEEKNQDTIRLIESLDRIDRHIESLTAAKTWTLVPVLTGSIDTHSGMTNSEIEPIKKEPDIPISWIFLAKIMPEITPKKVENSWFFGIRVMEKIVYSTYLDESQKIKIYAFQDTYETILLNMKLAGNVYTLNETDQFFWFTFFLNPTKKDPNDMVIRFIIALEGRAIWMEVPKNYYPIFKNILLKNK